MRRRVRPLAVLTAPAALGRAERASRRLLAALVATCTAGAGCGGDVGWQTAASMGVVAAAVTPGAPSMQRSSEALEELEAQVPAQASGRRPPDAGEAHEPDRMSSTELGLHDPQAEALLAEVDERDLLSALKSNMHHLYAAGSVVLGSVEAAAPTPSPADPDPIVAELKHLQRLVEGQQLPQGVPERVADAEVAEAAERARRVMLGHSSQRVAEEVGQQIGQLAAERDIFLPSTMQPDQAAGAAADDEEDADLPQSIGANQQALGHLQAQGHGRQASGQQEQMQRGTLRRGHHLLAYLRAKIRPSASGRSRLSLDSIARKARQGFAMFDHVRALEAAVAEGPEAIARLTLDVHQTLTEDDKVEVDVHVFDDTGAAAGGLGVVAEEDELGPHIPLPGEAPGAERDDGTRPSEPPAR